MNTQATLRNTSPYLAGWDACRRIHAPLPTPIRFFRCCIMRTYHCAYSKLHLSHSYSRIHSWNSRQGIDHSTASCFSALLFTKMCCGRRCRLPRLPDHIPVLLRYAGLFESLFSVNLQLIYYSRLGTDSYPRESGQKRA